MMIRRLNQRGLTLIEILVALAITGLLMSAIVFGRDSLRGQIVFSRNVDKMVNVLMSARSSRYFIDSSPVFIAPQRVLLGQAVYYANTDPFSNQLFGAQTSPIYYDEGTGLIVCNGCSSTFTPMTVATPTPFIIIFGITRDGQRVVYEFDGDTNPTDTKDYHPITTPFTFQLVDGLGHTADVTVDTQGNITRVIH